MIFRSKAKWIIGVVAAAIFAGASTAEAGWLFHRHRARGHGSSGGWGSSGGYGGSSGGWGSSGGYGSHGGWGSSGGWGGSSGGWGSSGGYGASYGGSYMPGTVIEGGGTVIEGAPTTPPAPPADGTGAPPPPPADGGAVPGGSTYLQRDAVMISVNVPAEAKIFVNGNLTRSTGASRQYISRGLAAGRQYTYELRAEVAVDGQTVSDTQVVQLTAGERTQVAFNLAAKAEQNAAKSTRTKLTLNVPADAKVYLAGQETKSTGERREFVSSKVAGGGKWDNYTIRVVANVNGQPQEKEQTIKLFAGEDQELTIDFDAAEVALTASR